MIKRQLDENRSLKEDLDEQRRQLEERSEADNEQLIKALQEAKTEKEKRLDYERRLRVVAHQQQQVGR